MIRKLMVAVAVLVALAFPPMQASLVSAALAPSTSLRLSELKKELQMKVRADSPSTAIGLGLHPRYPRLADISETKMQEDVAYYKGLRKALALRQRDQADLSPAELIDLRLMCAMVDFKLHDLIQWKGPEDAARGWREILSQSRDVGQYLVQHQSNLERGLADGIVPDRRSVENEIASAEAMAEFFGSELLVDAKETLGTKRLASFKEDLERAALSGQKAYQGCSGL